MIFVTVGTQLPFERLIKAMDDWSSMHPAEPVFAQLGDTCYEPTSMEFSRKVTPADYQKHFRSADVVVSHAGMGTIITGLEEGKPLILMPRLHALGEHRNDHQVGTAQRFGRFGSIHIAHSQEDLFNALDMFFSDGLSASVIEKPEPDASLLNILRTFAE